MTRRKRGRARRLTDLELEIMQVVWDAHPEPLTVRDVVEALSSGARRRPAYTTVQTVMGILCDKGALRSRPGPGRAHLYRAGLSREAARSSMTRDFLDRLFGGEAEPLLEHLVEHELLDRDALEELRRRIDRELGGVGPS